MNLRIKQKFPLAFAVLFSAITACMLSTNEDSLPSFEFIMAEDSAAFPPRAGHTTAVFKEKLWLIGGNDTIGAKNDVWYSEDGTNWLLAMDSAPFAPRTSHSCLVFENKLWVIGGYSSHNGDYYIYNDVWSSTDGFSWIQVTDSAAFPPGMGQAMAVFNGKMWLMGGANSRRLDIWSSADGKNWAESDSLYIPIPQRSCPQLFSFNSKLWVAGGTDAGFTEKDIWFTDDGTNWIKAGENYPGTEYSTCIVKDNALLVIAGFSLTKRAPQLQVYSSGDGKTWIERNTIGPGRIGFSTVVFNNKAWLFGGVDVTRFCMMNDVWRTR